MFGVSNATSIVCCIAVVTLANVVCCVAVVTLGNVVCCVAVVTLANVLCCVAVVTLGNDDHCSRMNYSVRLLSSLRTVVSLRRVQVGA